MTSICRSPAPHFERNECENLGKAVLRSLIGCYERERMIRFNGLTCPLSRPITSSSCNARSAAATASSRRSIIYGNLSAFYAMFPGNRQFNAYPLWLREDHHARLSSIFAPHLGHPHSNDLDAEYLNIFETRTRTPYFQAAYVNGVRVQLIIGPTGTGKSVHANQMLSLEQKYGGFTFIFDFGGSYESVVELYGGRIDQVGKDGPRINPFALEPTETNIALLHSFVKLLLTNSGANIGPEDDDDVFKSVKGIYNLPQAMRRLGNLTLPKHLDRYMAKWKDHGVYHAVFDNAKDSLTMSRLQCFDFQGVNNKQYADLIEPLMVWILRRIDEIVYDPKNLGVPKHVLIEEIFSNMKNKQLLEGASQDQSRRALISRRGGRPKNRLYSRLNWLGLS